MADERDGPDTLQVPFIFVKHGDPEPLAWMARHPGWVKIPAVLIPRNSRRHPANGGPYPTFHQEICDEWRPEEPPITTRFAAIGDRIAKDFGSTDVDTNSGIFSLIEDTMTRDDQGLVTAVATGLIEALATRAARNQSLWTEMVPLPGLRSLHYAQAWMAA